MASIDFLAKQARRVAAGMAGDVPSPCVSVCRMDDKVEYCVGCFRTLDEIAAWGRMADEEKKVIWKAIALRIEEAKP
jgi:predicted Fe-S protein YdhL (DUF1289 family)